MYLLKVHAKGKRAEALSLSNKSEFQISGSALAGTQKWGNKAESHGNKGWGGPGYHGTLL